jgi:2-polyprenyl-6-methoxyphenol hydroxylase-like FAD-dependent oxidoreductase
MDDVIIVGAGIGGLTLDLRCSSAVFPAGSSIGRRDPADRRRHQSSPTPQRTCRARIRAIAGKRRDRNQGRDLQSLWPADLPGAAGPRGGYQHPQFPIHRGDLQMILLEVFRARAGSDRLKTSHHCTGVGGTSPVSACVYRRAGWR